jgi:8-oxo-dGTP pyrophosphatase MutT (NUDIX family)
VEQNNGLDAMPKGWTDEEKREFRLSAPRKLIVSSLVAFNAGQLLLVKPAYRAGWLLPGGVVEQNESPAQGCVRECEEELGLTLSLNGLLLVDHTAEPEDDSADSLYFWFSTDELTQYQIDTIQLPEGELEDYQFVTPEEALDLLIVPFATRLGALIQCGGNNKTVLSGNGSVEYIL